MDSCRRSYRTLGHSKLMSRFKTSIFTELAQYKQKQLNEGKDIIDLSIGSPDLPPPPFVREELAMAVRQPGQYGYTLKGIDEFHVAVSRFYSRRYGVHLDANTEVVQLSGSQEGLAHLPLVFVNTGELILLPDPCYPAYETGVNLAQAEVYRMPLLKENNFLPDLKAIPKEVAKKAKMMFLNFPGNPIPAIPTKSFFEEVVHFAKANDLIVVHDFAYSELNFSDEKPLSLLAIEGAKEVGVEFNSLSKSFNMAGCRIAYAVGNEKIVQALSKLKSNLDFGVFMPIQRAAVKALNEGDLFLQELASIYKTRRDVFVDGLNNIGWQMDKPQATMFIWAPIPEDMSSLQFTFELMNKAGVVVTPGSAFGEYGEGYVRIGLVESATNLEQVVQKIAEVKLF